MLAQILAVMSGISLAAASCFWESRLRPVNKKAAIMLIGAIAWLSFIALYPLNGQQRATFAAEHYTEQDAERIDNYYENYFANRR